MDDADIESSTFQTVLEHVGSSGRWQFSVLLWTSLGVILTAFHNLSSVFLGATPQHRCSVTALNDSDFSPENLAAWIPWDNATHSWSHCLRYSTVADDSRVPVACDSWAYNRDQYQSTIVEDWNLVCQRTWLLSSVQSSYMLGSLFGALADGILSDYFGRKWTVLLSSVALMVSSIGVAFSRSYLVFLLLRMLSAVAQAGLFGSSFVLCMEIVGPRWRALMGMLYEIPFAIGFMLLSLIAYFVRDWVHLQLSISLPAVFLLIYWFVLPESPRWLIMNNRCDEALQVIELAAKRNRQPPPDRQVIQQLMNSMRSEECSRQDQMKNMSSLKSCFFAINNVYHLLKTPKMRVISLVSFFNWFIVALVYYGVTFQSAKLSDNPYLAIFLSGLVEIPAYLLSIPIINFLGRRPSVVLMHIAAACSLLLIIAVPTGMTWLKLCLGLAGKFSVTACFGVLYLYSAEYFPTMIRTIGVGASTMCSRAGSILAPFVVDLMGDSQWRVTSVVFGVASLLAAAAALLLPETNNKKLPESVHRVENGHWNKPSNALSSPAPCHATEV